MKRRTTAKVHLAILGFACSRSAIHSVLKRGDWLQLSAFGMKSDNRLVTVPLDDAGAALVGTTNGVLICWKVIRANKQRAGWLVKWVGRSVHTTQGKTSIKPNGNGGCW